MIPKLNELAAWFVAPSLAALWAFLEVVAYTWPFWSWAVIVWLMIRIGKKIDRRL